MPYTTLPDGIRLYYEFTGPEDKPVILQFGGSLFGRQNFGLVNDGFRENFRLLSFDARGYGRSDVPQRELQHRGLGRRRRGAARCRRARPRARARHLDGRHDRARVRLQVPGALHRRLPRRRLRAAGRPPQGDLPLLAALRRDDELGRLRRSRHDAGRRLPSPREARGREHVRDGAPDHAPQLDVHRAPGLPRDGGHGSRAARARARAPDPA